MSQDFNNFKCSIIDDVNYIFEERGNFFNAFRKVRWGDKETEYYEVRRFRNEPDGRETMGKAMTFLTEDGPASLINCLLEHGFGKTRDVLETISVRTDFRKALNSVLNDKDDEFYDADAGTEEDEFYDPKSILNGV